MKKVFLYLSLVFLSFCGFSQTGVGLKFNFGFSDNYKLGSDIINTQLRPSSKINAGITTKFNKIELDFMFGYEQMRQDLYIGTDSMMYYDDDTSYYFVPEDEYFRFNDNMFFISVPAIYYLDSTNKCNFR